MGQLQPSEVTLSTSAFTSSADQNRQIAPNFVDWRSIQPLSISFVDDRLDLFSSLGELRVCL